MRNPKNSKKYNAEFVVVKGNYTPLIGSRASQQMNLVTVHQENIQQVTIQNLTLNQVIEEFGDVFKGQGCMEGKLHLEIDGTVTPVINPPRRVPFALKHKLSFSKADLKDGFLHIELDDKSSLLTTFQTPWGRYCWKRMPFGISPAPELFQQKLDENLEGLPGVHRIFDDLLITGKGPTS